MENIEQKIKNKLADADLSGISDSAKSRMWGGIESGMEKLAANTDIASKATHMKVVHSRTVPVEHASNFAMGLIPKLAVASITIAMIIGVFFYFHENESSNNSTIHSKSVNFVDRTNPAEPIRINIDPMLNNAVIENEKNIDSQSAISTENNLPMFTDQSKTERQVRNESTAMFSDKTLKGHSSETAQNTSGNKVKAQSGDKTQVDETQSTKETGKLSGESQDSQAVSDEQSAEAGKTRAKDTIVGNKKTVIIQTTEEKIIKKRGIAGKQTNQ